MDEFAFIARHLVPLASDKSALGLKDDAAVLDVPAGHELVITKDAVTQGIHFVGNETPAQIARKLLRVNLSDLAAMGATPWGYFMALMLPSEMDEAWLVRFCEGLAVDGKAYNFALMGGDTTRTKGTLSFSVTALGLVPKGQALLRSGAHAGDDIYVSGTIGDAALGLNAEGVLRERYLFPQPRLALGEQLRGLATSCMDISDGLLQDLGHICAASAVGAEISWNDIPLSDAGRAALVQEKDPCAVVLAGGDDYELLFTAPQQKQDQILDAVRKAATSVTRIGRITHEKEVRALDANGNAIILSRQGYNHFES